MAVLEDGNVMDRLTAVLETNPRMAYITDTLYRTAMKALVKTVKFDGYDLKKYDGLMQNIAGELTRLQGQPEEQQIEELKSEAVKIMSDYGVDVPESVAEMVISTMLSEITPDEEGIINPSDVEQLFDKYYPTN